MAVTKYSKQPTKLSTKKSTKLSRLKRMTTVNLEHANKEPIVNFKFARLACSPFLCYKST